MDAISPESNPLRVLTDVALIRLLAERRTEALSELYRRHAGTLLALGKRILGGLAEAEEVLQEIFLHVWNHSDRYDAGRSSVSSWLILIARSRAIDRLRNRKVVERTHDAAALALPREDASSEGPDAVFVRERRQRVRQELDLLPVEQREVLEMAFYEGLSQSEIAERAALPLGTVKTRILLGMKKLRNGLRQEIRQLL
jgi:RNA polymerase sigma-70 factor (ECF subfamily)